MCLSGGLLSNDIMIATNGFCKYLTAFLKNRGHRVLRNKRNVVTCRESVECSIKIHSGVSSLTSKFKVLIHAFFHTVVTMWEHFSIHSDVNLSTMGIYDQLNLENLGSSYFFQYPHQFLSGATFLQTRLFELLFYLSFAFSGCELVYSITSHVKFNIEMMEQMPKCFAFELD